jgi:putative CocE/NonD family hydrolase
MVNLEVQRNVPVQMRDGVVLRADVYRPAVAGERLPVLLQRTPYGKNWLLGSGMPLDPLRAAAAGYAVVIQDTRGRFNSDGEFYPFTNEASDGYDTVEWCASQPWSDGMVGMYGRSYMGATCWQAARERPEHLVTMAPSQASSDYYEARSYLGGVFELGSLLSVALAALAPGSIARLNVPLEEARALTRGTRRLVDDLVATASVLPLDSLMDGPLGKAAPSFFDWMHHDTYDDYWDAIAVEPHYESIDIPALHITCWYDAFLRGSVRNYEGMVRTGKRDQRLVIGPWTHHLPMAAVLGSARVGDLNCGFNSMIDFDGLQLAWFDQWLKGKPAARGSANVRLFVIGKNEWRDYDAWPPPSTARCLYLASDGRANGASGGGRLDWEGSTGADQDAFVYDPADPVPTLGGAHVLIATSHPAGAFDQREIESRPDDLVYTSKPLPETVEVIGWITLTLWVASSAADTDFMAKLVDVYPDGRALNVCEGALRLALRESLREPAPYRPGEPVKIEIQLGPIAHAFLRGHFIRVDVTSSNFPRFARNLNTGQPFHSGDRFVLATQTVLHSSAYPSHLALPVVAG